MIHPMATLILHSQTPSTTTILVKYT